jgi:hypothetical protein
MACVQLNGFARARCFMAYNIFYCFLLVFHDVLQRYGEVNTPTSELITSHMQAMIQTSSTFDLVFCRRSEPLR